MGLVVYRNVKYLQLSCYQCLILQYGMILINTLLVQTTQIQTIWAVFSVGRYKADVFFHIGAQHIGWQWQYIGTFFLAAPNIRHTAVPPARLPKSSVSFYEWLYDHQ